jgi:septum site-determining protein MinC
MPHRPWSISLYSLREKLWLDFDVKLLSTRLGALNPMPELSPSSLFSTRLASEKSAPLAESAEVTSVVKSPVLETPSSPEAADLSSAEHLESPSSEVPLLDVSRARTAVHALNEVEGWLQQQAIEVSGEDPRLCWVDVGALVLGNRQLVRLQQTLKDQGWRMTTLKAQAPVTRQFAQSLGLPLEQDITAATLASEKTASASLMTTSSSPSSRSGASSSEATSERTRRTDDRGVSDVSTPELPQGQCLYVKANLRSGQSIEHHGDVILLGHAHPGSEIRASGDIVVWGQLRGIAHAGCFGNRQAEIRALKMDPLQLRIADMITRRPDRWVNPLMTMGQEQAEVSLSGQVIPEVARIQGQEIVILAGHSVD